MKSNKNKKNRWAILCSGWGSNAIDVMQEYSRSPKYSDFFSIDLFIYDNDECGAIDTAKENGIETLRIKRSDYKNPFLHQRKIIKELELRNIDYIFLMNYKYLIRKEMLESFPNRIINVHPSLFPSFLATKSAIQDALAYGVKVSGITTHIIDEEYDRGTILHQKPIKIKENDTFESLYVKFRKKGKKILLKTMLSFSLGST